MKTLKIAIVLICMSVLSSCGFILTNMANGNTTLTNVELSQKNFVVKGQVDGSSSHWYIIGFGGLSRQLYAKAKNEMIQKASLKGKARAIVDITYETHVAFFVVVEIRTVTATGTVIEFTK